MQQVYSVPEEDGQSFLSCDISQQSDWLVVGQTDGSVVQLDPRGIKIQFSSLLNKNTELNTKPNALH